MIPQPTPRGTDMANPETTTPSVEGDRLEQIARLVAPRAWWLRDWIAGSPERVQLNLGRRAAGFPDEDKLVAASLKTARQIAALPCKGGEDVEINWRKFFLEAAEARDKAGFLGTPAQCIEFLDAEVRRLEALATPTTEADTGRGLREALERINRTATDAAMALDADYNVKVGTLVEIYKCARQALAALSDTPRERDSSSREALTHPKVDAGPLPHAITDHDNSQPEGDL